MENLKIWIVHYTPLKERKEFLEKELQERKLNYEFIELYDKECLPDFYLNKFNLDSHHFKNLGTVSLFIKYMYTLSLVKDSEFDQARLDGARLQAVVETSCERDARGRGQTKELADLFQIVANAHGRLFDVHDARDVYGASHQDHIARRCVDRGFKILQLIFVVAQRGNQFSQLGILGVRGLD